MGHRLLLVLLLLAVAVAAAPGTACACSCAVLTPAEQPERATAVFTGTAVGARQVRGDPSGPPSPIVHRFRVDHAYKGDVTAWAEVASSADGAACGYRFTVGSRYLVFASDKRSSAVGGDPGVALTTSLCDGNQLVGPGDVPLRREDRFGDGAPIGAEFLAALGTARRPAPGGGPSTGDAAPPGAAAEDGTTVPPPLAGAAGAVTVAAVALAFAAGRWSGRRRRA
ncbi:hypothetical protein GCM10010466_41800 [Planomonospora alba]|uniref:Tissue inhibitor of metalloproteinase n=1 Tax=Planomonospora alba TaxID=161354 RepID=A0ABP6NG90_9ACTN